MRFHILGMSHSKTRKDYSADAFSQKCRLLCKLLTDRGHTVYHYGTEGSDPVCTENVPVVSKQVFDEVHGGYDWKRDGFLINTENRAYKDFIENSVREIRRRAQPRDFLLCTFGTGHKPIADALPDLIVCEPGIGYEFSFAPHRVFESYPMMNYVYGRENKLLSPSLYDAVIPNYYDLDDYIFSEHKQDYFFFIGRPTPLKGLEIAIKCVEHAGAELIVAGQGEPPFKSDRMRHVGVVSIEQRAVLMSGARATFVPTYYIEPFGSTVIESLLCGTPVIATDLGAFSDTVVHGKVGYRCRTLEQFHWATQNIGNISPRECRRYAEANYSLERVGAMYDEYFDMLHRLYTDDAGWYQRNDQRSELDWLNRYV